jgi:hypothetical protein
VQDDREWDGGEGGAVLEGFVIHVISTGYAAPTRERCIKSVEMQDHPHVHHYVEASGESHAGDIDGSGRCALENFTRVARTIDPADILCSVDGDDWLPRPDVLSRIAAIYADPNIWLTYGSFTHADGRPGFAAPVQGNVRTGPWLLTHLKTFRASLFQKLTDDDLMREGKYRDLAWDATVMYPMYELAGWDRCRFVSDILYVYNYAHSFEHSASPSDRARERAMVSEIRGMAPKMRLETL